MMKKRASFTPFQILVHAVAWIPLAWLVWDYAQGNMSINPIQEITQRTGRYALYLLVASLACTPANTIFGFRQAITVRRALGLYAFMYASLHFLTFSGLDYAFDWSLLQGAIFEKRYTLVGFTALTILLLLALTSTKGSMKRLGKNWKRLHKLVYVAGGLVILHYAWAVKGDLLRLQGDIWKPLAFGIVVALLLVARIPAVRKKASQLRQRLAPKKGKNGPGPRQASQKLRKAE